MGLSQENRQMSEETNEDAPRNRVMSQESPFGTRQMSQEKLIELDDDDLKISLNDIPKTKKTELRKRKRQQGIISLIKQNPKITMEEMADKLDVNARTIHRDVEELKNVIEHVGPTKGGYWVIF